MSQENKTIKFTVPFTSRGKFPFTKQNQQERVFSISEAKVCTIRRITKILHSLPNEIYGSNSLEVGVPLVAEHIDKFIYVIAAAIQNDEYEPKQSLLDFLDTNLSRSLLLEGFNTAIVLLGLNDFISAYAIIKSTGAIIDKTES